MLNYKLRSKTIKENRRGDGRGERNGVKWGRKEKDKGGEEMKKIPLFRVFVMATFSPSNLLKEGNSLSFFKKSIKEILSTCIFL